MSAVVVVSASSLSIVIPGYGGTLLVVVVGSIINCTVAVGVSGVEGSFVGSIINCMVAVGVRRQPRDWRLASVTCIRMTHLIHKTAS